MATMECIVEVLDFLIRSKPAARSAVFLTGRRARPGTRPATIQTLRESSTTAMIVAS